MADTGFPVVRQDVRREFAHGHELDHELREMERLAERALEDVDQRALHELKKRGHQLEERLRREGYDDLADFVHRSVVDVERRRGGDDSLPSDLDFS